MQLEADKSKKFVYVSKCCSDNKLPDMDDILAQVTGKQDYVLVGYSQAGMLRGAKYLEHMMQKLLEIPVSGHTVILLDHCEAYARKFFLVHPDIQKRIVLVEGKTSVMPKIRLTSNKDKCLGYSPLSSMKYLFEYFERLTDDSVSQNPEIAVVTNYSSKLFKKALFSVSDCESIYSALCKKYYDLAAATEQSYGVDDQW